MGRGVDEKIDNIPEGSDKISDTDGAGDIFTEEVQADKTDTEKIFEDETAEESNIDTSAEDRIFDEEIATGSDDAMDKVFNENTDQVDDEGFYDDSAATAVMSVQPENVQEPLARVGDDGSARSVNVREDSCRSHRALKIAGIICAAVIICTYVAVSVWFMFHYNYKTYINGSDYSFYTLNEVDKFISEYISGYSLTLKLRDDSEYRIKPEDIGLVISPNVTAKKIISEQNGFLWPYYMCKRKDYELYYTADYDKDKLESLLKKCDFTQESNMEKPTDASVIIKDGKSTIIPETEGNYIDFTKLCCIINEALTKGDKLVDLEETDVYAKPTLTATSDEIVAEQAKLEKVLSMKITYKIDEVSWELTSEDYGDWISDITAEKIEFQKDKVQEYVQNMADRYDTYGVPRNFRTHDGRTVTLDNTWYGWLIDVEGETEKLYTLLEAGESVERTPLLDCYAAVYRDGGDDIGNTYIECDFGQQHIYVYVNGDLVMDSDCVTGSLAQNGKYRTPGGVYTILYTKTPAVLIGDDYETPVKYWMPFIGELGIGFHDATWRSAFGGDIYKTSGSHGCVNLPLSAAEQLFNIAYDGMPVVCYY